MIAIGLGMPAWSGPAEADETPGLKVFALRGVVAAALTTIREPVEIDVEPPRTSRGPNHQRIEPPIRKVGVERSRSR